MNNTENIKSIWTDEYIVKSYHTDFNQKLRLSAMFSFMQESAWHHASHLGFGFEHLQQTDCLWVLSRLYLKVERYPEWNETITLETWPKGINKLFAMRDFLFKDEQGNVIARGSSYWIIINYKTRRPQKLDLVEHFRNMNNDLHAVNHELERLKVIESKIGRKIKVLHSDIDLNQHVNNSKYLDWILDSFDHFIHSSFEVDTVQIDFMHEIKPKEDIELHSQEADIKNTWNFTGKSLSTEKTNFNARLSWRAIQ